MKIDLDVPKIFKPLFRGELAGYREIFYAGGRGSGKTSNPSLYLALKFARERDCNILCLREYAKNTGDSLKAEFDAIFKDWGFLDIGVSDGVLEYIENTKGVDSVIKIKTTQIVNNLNGNKIIFAGITKHSVRGLKSLKGIKYCFIDESDFLGEEEYKILKPTIRAEGSQIICCFNPKNDDDYIYKLFNEPDPRRYAKKVNWGNNPFFPKVLNDDRLADLKKLPYVEYLHIWEGHTKQNIKGVIFSQETINLLLAEPIVHHFDKERFSKVVISCDPASTNKDHSNEYGIIVLGVRLADGFLEVIDDLSDNLTPEQFVGRVESAYFDYSCDYVVVETNQGGDFIKHSILTKNPTILVKEVRAVKDKVNRASPVANVASLGKILLRNHNRDKLIRQMKRLTNNGYLGIRGESPDRLDAMVWGVYDLLGISEFGTSGRVFKDSFFIEQTQGAIFHHNIGYIWLCDEGFAVLVFDILGEGENKQFDFKECKIGEIDKAIETINQLEITHAFINDGDLISLADDLIIEFDSYDESGEDLETISSRCVALGKNKVCLKNVVGSSENGFYDNLLFKNLVNYDKNQKIENLVVRLFCETILNEAI